MLPKPHRLHAKLFFDGWEGNDLSVFVPAFHRWIQRRPIDQLLIDVHNYAHIHQGPGILLVGHEGDYAIDKGEARVGLLYRLKRDVATSLAGAVTRALRRVAVGALLLENDQTLADLLSVNRNEFELTIVDRIEYPNTPEAFERIEQALAESIGAVTGAADLALERVQNDPREALAIRVVVPAGLALEAVSEPSATAEIV